MGTRSITKVFEQNGKQILSMYGQFDGYPDGLGKELAEFVASKTIVNGIPLHAEKAKLANGMSCLAAQIVAHFKKSDEPGNFYLYPCDDEGDAYVDYIYEVRKDSLRCLDRENEVLYDGPASGFAAFASGRG